MAKLSTCKEIAQLWNISERRVALLCKQGRLAGAAKVQGQWLIPANAEKPADARVRGGNYRKAQSAWLDLRNPMALGLSDYSRASSAYHYVDKTLMIKEFLDSRATLTLFVRPQGYGKSLAMDMLRTFFGHAEKDTAAFFRYKNIWAAETQYRKHQGHYPVVTLSFKDFDFDTWEDAQEKIRSVVRAEFGRHAILSFSPRCSAFHKTYYQAVVDDAVSAVDFTSSLANLTAMLADHYGVAPIVFVDDYDKPMRAATENGYAKQMAALLRNLYGGCFKDNPALSFGFMAGETYTPSDGVIASLGNVVICTDESPRYATSFGFTHDELLQLADYYLPEAEACDASSAGSAKDRNGKDNAKEESVSAQVRQRNETIEKLVSELEKAYGMLSIAGQTACNPWDTANYFNAILSAQLEHTYTEDMAFSLMKQ